MIKPFKGNKYFKKCFSPVSEPHTAKLCFSVVLKHFLGNSQRTSLFSPKIDYLRKEPRNTQKFFFLNKFEKGKILRKIWICLNNFFWSNQKRGQILTKTVFLLKTSHIQTKLCFSVVLKHFLGNSQRTSLFSPKSDHLRKEHRNTQKFFFS